VDAHVCETLAQNVDLTLRDNSEYLDRRSVHLLQSKATVAKRTTLTASWPETMRNEALNCRYKETVQAVPLYIMWNSLDSCQYNAQATGWESEAQRFDFL
jgi:O-succinylbenzoate synthase